MSELEVRLEKLEKEDLANRWKMHREVCVKLAIKMGVTSAEEAVELAEELGAYIRNGKQEEH